MVSIHARRKRILIPSERWQHIARRLKMLDALREAQRIEARNDRNGSWLSGAEVKERMERSSAD